MLRIAFCDNNKKNMERYTACVNQVSSHFASAPFTFSSAKVFDQSLSDHGCPYDIVVMNLELKAGSSIDLARRINVLNPLCHIIFVSPPQAGLMSMAYDANHFYALLDSEIEHRFPIALDKAIEKAEEAQARRLVITQKNRQFIIAQPNIIYFERILRITEINCTSEFYSTYESLDQLQKQLNPDLFIRCHQSYIVNLEKIGSFSKTSIIMENGRQIPVSRAHYKQMREKFLKFIDPHASLSILD